MSALWLHSARMGLKHSHEFLSEDFRQTLTILRDVRKSCNKILQICQTERTQNYP